MALVAKNLPANAGDIKDVFNRWVGMYLPYPGGRVRQSTPVFLPGEAQGQRSLAGYSPWACKELDMTEAT